MVWREWRYAARVIRRQPGFAAIVVLTIGLGVGANSAIFSVVNALLLSDPPFQNPDRLVYIQSRRGEEIRV